MPLLCPSFWRNFIDFFHKYISKHVVVFDYFISSKIQMQLQICNGFIWCLETFVPILSYWSGLKCEVVEICCKNLKLLQENSCLCPFSLHCSSTFQQCSSCNTLLVFLKFCWLLMHTRFCRVITDFLPYPKFRKSLPSWWRNWSVFLMFPI